MAVEQNIRIDQTKLARICVADYIQNSLRPVLVIRTDDNNSEAMLVAFHQYAF